MADTRYSITGYKRKLRRTRNRVILVEGRDDKRVFRRLLQECSIAPASADRSEIVVDTAEMLESPNPSAPLSNREKVEAVCQGAIGERFGARFVGFVDREYRGFTLDQDEPIDELGDHQVDGRLVWSRGHSLENYYLDLTALREPLRTFSVSDHFDEALGLFDQCFAAALCMACALSLVARDTDRMGVVKGSIRWSVIDLQDGKVTMDAAQWQRVMRQMRLDQPTIDVILKGFRFWTRRFVLAHSSVARWICHGHLGLACLWAVYARCVYEVNGRDAHETARILRVEESVRFNACLESWIREGIDELSGPLIVLRMLGL